jgi:hypothetical protein
MRHFTIQTAKIQTAGLIIGLALTGQAAASIASAPTCVLDTSTNEATISVTVDSGSTLSASAIIQLGGVAITGSHSLSDDNRTLSAVLGQTCDNKADGQITIVDGTTTHQ